MTAASVSWLTLNQGRSLHRPSIGVRLGHWIVSYASKELPHGHSGGKWHFEEPQERSGRQSVIAQFTQYDANTKQAGRALLICGGDLRARSLVARLVSQMGCETKKYDRLVDLPRDHIDDTVAGLIVIESPQGPNARANLTSLPEELAWMPTVVLSVPEQTSHEPIAIRSGIASQVLGLACDAAEVSSVLAALLRRHDKRISGKSNASNLAAAKRGLEGLSERHHFVLARVLCGMLNKKIARELGVSIRTVETYRSQIHKAARVTSLAELVRVCVKIGYIDTFDTVNDLVSSDAKSGSNESVPIT